MDGRGVVNGAVTVAVIIGRQENLTTRGGKGPGRTRRDVVVGLQRNRTTGNGDRVMND